MDPHKVREVRKKVNDAKATAQDLRRLLNILLVVLAVNVAFVAMSIRRWWCGKEARQQQKELEDWQSETRTRRKKKEEEEGRRERGRERRMTTRWVNNDKERTRKATNRKQNKGLQGRRENGMEGKGREGNTITNIKLVTNIRYKTIQWKQWDGKERKRQPRDLNKITL